ncbi:murein biosynthesis integral membrane protein MurJ [Paraburkholderia sp. IW21]|uniref:murein biosynthesis integral membrane protein MurJ n=1 Tax=Paraburkholderia sp. IW21 TaxID=3242488 RepID=UPI003522628B
MLTATIESLRRRLLGVHQDHKRIARSALILLGFVLAGKIVSASKEMMIAYRYGISGTVDAYQLALTLVTWIPTTLTSELGVLLVPALINLRKDKLRQNQFLGELEGLTLVFGIASALLLCLFWPHLAGLVSGKLSASTQEMCRQMIVGMTPVGVLTFTICISAARLQACEKHINTLLECVPAIALLVFVLGMRNNTSVLPLILGTTIGFIIQAAFLRILARKADSVRALPRLSLRSSQWPGTFRAMGVLMMGAVIGNLAGPVDQYFLAHLGDGAIATLGYANRLLALLLSMGALAISRATLPILSEILFSGDHARARSTALKWSLLMLVVGAIGACIAYLMAPYAIALLFQRGAFTGQDTIAVASLFRAGLVQIPFAFAVWVLVQLFVSEARFKEISVIAIVGFVIKLAGNIVLIRLFGIVGVFFSTGFAAAGVFLGYLLCARFAPQRSVVEPGDPADPE